MIRGAQAESLKPFAMIFLLAALSARHATRE
jgi:hypothetical protein